MSTDAGAPPPPEGASGLACVTSLRCPAGERCDGGVCVLDRGCPAPFGPNQVPRTSPPLYFTSGLSLYEGEEHVVASDLGFDLVLVRLSDSRVRTIARPAVCNQNMLYLDDGPFRVWCRTKEGHAVFRELSPGAADTLTPASPVAVTLQPGEDVQAIGFPSADLELVASTDSLRLVALVTGASTALFALETRTLQGVVRADMSSGARILAKSSEAAGDTWWAAPPETGASWQKLGTLPKATAFVGVAPVGTDWYAVEGDYAGARDVYRFEGGQAVLVGTAAAGVALPSSSHRLDAPNGHATLLCEDKVHCTLHRTNLDPPSSEPLARVDMPTGDGLGVVLQRALACSSVEAFVGTIHEQVGQWPTLAYYLVRVTP